MSIYAYTGLPGSGKSYSVVEHQILPALKAGRRLVTNVSLKLDKLREDFPNAELVELPTQRVQAEPACIYEYVTPGSVLVLDEVWRLFPAGLKANHVPEAFRKLLAEHRHMVDDKGDSCQIILVTQDLAQISAFARQLVETTFRTVKLTNVGLSGQFRVDVHNGPAVGPNPPEHGKIRQIFGRYESKVYQYYESHTLRGEGQAVASKVNEKSLDKRANILRRPIFLVGAIAVPLLIGWGVRNLLGFFEDQGVPIAGAGAAAPPTATATPRPPMPVHRSDENPPTPSPVATSSSSSAAAVLVGVIENLDAPDRSVALVKTGGRVLSRPLRFCDDRGGWWVCSFPDLGELSL